MMFGFLVLVVAVLAGANASAILPGGCIDPGKPQVPHRSVDPQPFEETPRELPAVHATRGMRTAGSQTPRMRVFELRATGYLSAAELTGITAASRYSRTPVSFTLGIADWGQQVRLVVDTTADFKIILRSDNPGSFDSYEFVEVEPGTYVFTLDSLGCRREPLDVDLRFRGRVAATRTVRPEVMEHPAMALPGEKKEGPWRALRVSQSQ